MKLLKNLYNWVLHWAHTPYGKPALFGISFAEASFFPIPPDVLQIALSISRPQKSFLYAGISVIASLLGAALGYFIGFYFMEVIGWPILNMYGLHDKYEQVRVLFERYDAWAIMIAGFTPIPFKLFTIASGAFHIQFAVLMLASFVSRAGRFFLVAALIYKYGGPIKVFIDKYFNFLTILFIALIIGGFWLIKVVLV